MLSSVWMNAHRLVVPCQPFSLNRKMQGYVFVAVPDVQARRISSNCAHVALVTVRDYMN